MSNNKRRHQYPKRISLKDEVPGGPVILQTHPHRETLSWCSLCPQTGRTQLEAQTGRTELEEKKKKQDCFCTGFAKLTLVSRDHLQKQI